MIYDVSLGITLCKPFTTAIIFRKSIHYRAAVPKALERAEKRKIDCISIKF